MNRCFTEKQKTYLYIMADGKCEKCGELLDDKWEAHHEKQYVNGGVTEIENGSALCAGCHRDLHRSKLCNSENGRNSH